MSIVLERTDNPALDAERYFNSLDIEHRKWIQGNANCSWCGELITSEDCVVIREKYIPACMCKRCLDKRKKLLTDDLSDEAYAVIDEYINLLEDNIEATPHYEEKEWN